MSPGRGSSSTSCSLSTMARSIVFSSSRMFRARDTRVGFWSSRGDTADCKPMCPVVLMYEVIHKQRDVFAPIPQRRNMNGQNIQPIK